MYISQLLSFIIILSPLLGRKPLNNLIIIKFLRLYFFGCGLVLNLVTLLYNEEILHTYMSKLPKKLALAPPIYKLSLQKNHSINKGAYQFSKNRVSILYNKNLFSTNHFVSRMILSNPHKFQ